ncbi:YihY/virulence factor BrkB family protein [Mangrovicoccus algicola]|uniref:YihY/virulence factor BrkB family protein n=1 Tax=Mangrovicoccus algicola TaxID=2771008 RepID=A0A8J6YXQ8_9RHOB|nr:YihY/virulence factor BrkB family protein [Mangrovicoccus algicola]MBE3638419.1 YihY/virulence factor BrkB family protein [Mangrovicoccus algicola]
MTLLPRYKAGMWRAALTGAFAQLDEKNLTLIAAGVAFYSLLSLFPAITALVSVWGVFADPVRIESQLSLLQQFAPETAYELIAGQVASLVNAPPSALSWAGAVSLVVALWSAKAGVGALTRGLNAVYGEKNRSGMRDIAVSLALTALLLLLTAAVLALLVVLPLVLALLPVGALAEILVRLAKWVVAIGLIVLSLGLVYRIGPNRRSARVAWLSPGALLATLVWTAASVGFTFYLERFASYNEVYGSLGAVIALLMWFFISALVVLLGAAVNAELERHTLQDSTVGRSRPIGQRGAEAADTYMPVE